MIRYLLADNEEKDKSFESRRLLSSEPDSQSFLSTTMCLLEKANFRRILID